MQLRQKLKTQTEEVTQLQSKLSSVHSEHQKEVSHILQTCIVAVLTLSPERHPGCGGSITLGTNFNIIHIPPIIPIYLIRARIAKNPTRGRAEETIIDPSGQ